jgi:hypothetical protein
MNRLLIMLGMGVSLIGCSGNSLTFADKILQGVLDGQPWQAEQVESVVYDFGSRQEERACIYSAQCEEYECLAIESPSINISDLDMSSESGNLSHENGITIFIPPNKNVRVTEGFYRFSTAGDNTKLELRFTHDERNQVDGYIIY